MRTSEPSHGGLRGWPLAIVVFFLLLAAFHGVVFYLAATHPDPVVDSYRTNAR
jgi:hypothetical protein